MAKIMQNLVVLMEPTEYADRVSLKAGKMYLNRFCIDEDAAFELSGVNYLQKSSRDIEDHRRYNDNHEFQLKRKEKGKEYLI